jgi:hypothetical protein
MLDEIKLPVPASIAKPLECFGDGFQAADAECAACPHRQRCMVVMGKRRTHVPLSSMRFSLVPASYNIVYENTFIEDPEIANMPRTYIACYRTLFECHPKDTSRVQQEAENIVRAATRNDCSVRLYMLACMMGHAVEQSQRVQHGGRNAVPFTVKNLLGKIPETRAKMFRDLCAKEYGTFSVSALSTLTGTLVDKSSPEYKLLTSEIKAGQFIVDWKSKQGGPVYEALYSELELTLDPMWLAIEDSYKVYVLDPYQARRTGTDMEKSHRHAVAMSISYLKKHKQAGIMAFQARESVMAKAVADVLSLIGYSPDDFLIENEPVTDTIGMWVSIGLAVQHHQCLRYLDGERSTLFRS